MALINCPECNKEISNTAKTCPSCGYRLTEKKYKKIIIPIILVAMFIGLIVFLLLFNRDNVNKPKHLSQAVYKNGIEAVNIIDNVLDGKKDTDTAYEELEKLYDRTYIIEKRDLEENSYPLYCEQIYLFILEAKTHMYIYELNSNNYEELVEIRNNLAEELNIKKR
jgi:hypothetical protein